MRCNDKNEVIAVKQLSESHIRDASDCNLELIPVGS